MPSSSCTSSRGRSSRPRARRSASSPAARASAGTTSRSPARRATPAPRRCRAARTRWWRPRRSIARLDEIAREHAPYAVVTVGDIRSPSPRATSSRARSGSRSTSATRKSPSSRRWSRGLREAVAEACARDGLPHQVDRIWYFPPVAFDDTLHRRRAQGGAGSRLLLARDGLRPRPRQLLHRPLIPTSMIFIPCRDGLSTTRRSGPSRRISRRGQRHAARGAGDGGGVRRGPGRDRLPAGGRGIHLVQVLKKIGSSWRAGYRSEPVAGEPRKRSGRPSSSACSHRTPAVSNSPLSVAGARNVSRR